jgi:hypothetical protein
VCVCLFVFASTEKVNLLIIVLQSHVVINAWIIKQFKINLQFYFMWWDLRFE